VILIAVCSAKGGSARTTTCVRLAQALNAARIPTGIVDLSPYPSVQFMLAPGDAIPVIGGRAATTPIAARSIVRPYEERCSCLLIDTSRLDDPAILPWLPLMNHFLVTMKIDKNSVRAMPSIWDSFDTWKAINPELKFLGFLPTCVEPSQQAVVRGLRNRMEEHFLPVAIPRNDVERLGPELVTRGAEWDTLAAHLRQRASLKQILPEPARNTEKGLVTRMWKLAASVLGPKVSVVTEAAR